jgi:hypothetical protein
MPLAAKCRSSNSSPRKTRYLYDGCIKLSIIIYIYVNIFKIDGELCEFTLLYFLDIFLYLFGGLDGGWLLLCFAYVAHFCIFERCLDSNAECCRS